MGRLRPSISVRFLAVLAVAGLAPGPTAAGDAVAGGNEFQVNTSPVGDRLVNQRALAIASNASGSFVVAWQSEGSSGGDSSALSIQGQRFDSLGARLGGEFQVNTYTDREQFYPALASSADGSFVVVWESLGSASNDPSNSVQGQRFAPDGATRGAEFQVNAYTTSLQRAPSVAMDADGDFVVVWASDGSAGTDASGTSIQGQRFAPDGTRVGVEFQVNTYTTSSQTSATVATAANGDFVVVWQSNGSAGTDDQSSSVQGQRFASDGTRQGAEFQVNTYVTGGQGGAAVAVVDDGGFVVVWSTSGPADGDPYSSGVRGQRFAPDGSKRGAEFQVNTSVTGGQRQAAVAAGPGGDFVAVWASNVAAEWSVRGQRFASDGTPRGGEFQVNSYTTGLQSFPAVSSNAVGDFVVAWRSDPAPNSAASSYSIRGQRFTPPRDYGDAPDPTFPTLEANDGARHNVEASSVWLGGGIDAEADGQPTAAATGDDADGTDDEDGITFTAPLARGGTATVRVVASAAAYLDAWVDFDADGDWNDAGENVFHAEPLTGGTNGLAFVVPADATLGHTTARFRISSVGGLSFEGVAADGEVEDYQVSIESPPSLAVITQPIPDTVLPGASVTFEWSSGAGALEYWLQVGTTKAGGREVFDGSTGLTRSQAVDGIPANGGTIYARLWTRLPGGWAYRDYTYTAPGGGGGGGAGSITSPSPGTTLPVGPVSFEWNPSAGALEYWLQVGTSKAGSREVFDASTGLTPSQAVTGIPGNGATIYVRLWTRLPAGWGHADYTYTASSGGGGSGAALVTGPTPGSVLPLGPVRFEWSPGAGSRFHLQVGTTKPGSREVFDLDVGSATSQVVSGIPGGGVTIHVRLWSLVSGKWQREDVTYTSPDGRAEIVSPTPGSQLSGTSATFAWTAGVGATSYWLQVGTTKPGSRDVFDRSMGLSLSQAVTGIPASSGVVYVRLWTRIAGAWFRHDYTYTASGP